MSDLLFRHQDPNAKGTCIFCRREQTFHTHKTFTWWSCVVSLAEVTNPICPWTVAKRVWLYRHDFPFDPILHVRYLDRPLTDTEAKEIYALAWDLRFR